MEIVGWMLTATAVLSATKLLALGLVQGGVWLKKRFCVMTLEKWAAWVSSLDPAKVLGWLSLGYGAALRLCRNNQSLLEKLRRTRQGPGTGGASGGERK